MGAITIVVSAAVSIGIFTILVIISKPRLNAPTHSCIAHNDMRIANDEDISFGDAMKDACPYNRVDIL